MPGLHISFAAMPVHPWSWEAKVLGSLKLACGHLARLAVTLKFKAELLAFNDRAHAGAFDGRDVNEDVGAAVVRLNEAEALGGIEPFNCASGHNEPFHSNIDNPPGDARRVFRLLRGKLRQEAQCAAKTNIGKQSIDIPYLMHHDRSVNFLF
jgi:hypothetical protein